MAIVALIMWLVTGCGAPQLHDQLADERVVAVEGGTRTDLVRVLISWPAFPTGFLRQFISETQPAPDAGSLRRFVGESPRWREVATLDHFATALISYGDCKNRAFILSIHPIVVGVTAEPIRTADEASRDGLLRPDDVGGKHRIVKLIHATRFPTLEEKVAAREDANSSTRQHEVDNLIALLRPRIINLDRPLTIEDAISYIEAHETLHRIGE